MPVTTRATARHGYRLRRWSRRVRGLTGGVLVLVGGVAMGLGFLGGVLAFFVVLDTSSGLDPQLRPQILTVWLWVAAVAISARVSARTLRNTPRRMVLWLRRFRHTDSIRAVSSALDHLGYSWRVVTLDDATAQPYGAAAGLRLGVSAATVVQRAVTAGQRWASVWGVWVARGYAAAWVVLIGWTVWQGEPLTVLDSLAGDWRQWPVPWTTGAARLLVGAGIAFFVGLLAFVAVTLVLMLLLPLIMSAGSVGTGVRAAEQHKRQQVATLAGLAEVSETVATASRAALAPRLIVVTVESAIWREAVLAFARSAEALLLDVSAASEALLWEVRELGAGGVRLVFVGEQAAVERLVTGDDATLTTPELALREALEGGEILTYRPTAWGRVRFQRALYGTLEATASPRVGLVAARRWAVAVVAVGIVIVGLHEIVTTVRAWPGGDLVA